MRINIQTKLFVITCLLVFINKCSYSNLHENDNITLNLPYVKKNHAVHVLYTYVGWLNNYFSRM